METNEIVLLCKRTIENNPDYDAKYYNKTAAILCKGNTLGSLIVYRNSVKNDPDHATVFMNIGLIKAGFE